MRASGRAAQVHPRLLGRAVALGDVALDAGQDDVFPRRASAARAGDDMINGEVLAGGTMAAILAGIAVAQIDIAPVEFDDARGHPMVTDEADDLGHEEAEGGSAHEQITVRGDVLTQLAPGMIIMGLIIFGDDLGQVLHKEDDGPLDIADVNRGPISIKNEYPFAEHNGVDLSCRPFYRSPDRSVP